MHTDDDAKLSAQRWYLSVESLDSQFGDDSTVDAKPMQFDIKLLDDNPTGIEKNTADVPDKGTSAVLLWRCNNYNYID